MEANRGTLSLCKDTELFAIGKELVLEPLASSSGVASRKPIDSVGGFLDRGELAYSSLAGGKSGIQPRAEC
jgi:hypothetical protein